MEAIVPTEIDELSFLTEHFDSDLNNQGLSLNLDVLEIKRDKAQIRMVANQKVASRSYNSRVKIRWF